jgi:hypothetical protein
MTTYSGRQFTSISVARRLAHPPDPVIRAELAALRADLAAVAAHDRADLAALRAALRSVPPRRRRKP